MTIWQDLLKAGSDALEAIAPGAVGAAVAQAFKQGLHWRERIVQWLVGISVSYFVTIGLADWLALSVGTSQSLGFVIGVVAFQATPGFMTAAAAAIARIPDTLLKKKDGA